jgi:spermidine/putrescine transport system permease protein
MRFDRWFNLSLLGPGMVWLLAFVIAPFAFAVAISFWTSNLFGLTPDFQFGNYVRVLGNPVYRDLIFKTVRIAFFTTAIALFLSYPIAYLISSVLGRLKLLLTLALFLPFWTSYVVRSFVWLPILGTNGAINRALLGLGLIDHPLTGMLYNEGSVYVGLVYVYTLFMALPILLAIERIDARLIEAAADLGATPLLVFRTIILPLSFPGIVSGCIMVFLLAMSSFVTPQLLGGPSGVMVSGLVAEQFQANNDWALGSALALVLCGMIFIILLVVGRWIGLRQLLTAGRG